MPDRRGYVLVACKQVSKASKAFIPFLLPFLRAVLKRANSFGCSIWLGPCVRTYVGTRVSVGDQDAKLSVKKERVGFYVELQLVSRSVRPYLPLLFSQQLDHA